MIHMPHHRNNRRSWLEIFRIVILISKQFIRSLLRIHKIHIGVILSCNQFNCRRIQPLIDRYHHPKCHTRRNNLRRAHVQQIGQITHRDKLGHINDVILQIIQLLLKLQFLLPVLSTLLSTLLPFLPNSAPLLNFQKRFFQFLFRVLFVRFGVFSLLRFLSSLFPLLPGRCCIGFR